MKQNRYPAFPFALPFVLDGATGTELAKYGMKKGDCTERFILEHPETICAVQSAYIEAGSDAVLAPTFGANLPTLERHGFAPEEADGVCRRLAAISKENAAGRAKIGGDLSPTGLLLSPYGDTEPEEIYRIYREEARSLLAAGVDFIEIETMISAAETRLAVMAVRELSEAIPVFVTMTVNENGRTMNGDSLDAVLVILAQYHIQAFGCNCSIGPDVILKALTPVSPIARALGIPLIAKPNAGMPQETENGTFFPLKPEDMAAYVEKFVKIGAVILGGCCGSTPEHLRAIAEAVHSTEAEVEVEPAEKADWAATPRVLAPIDPEADYTVVTADDEDALYDLSDEAEPDDVLYLELEEGAAELVIAMDAYLNNPIALRGNPKEIEAVRRALCRKVE